MKRISDALAGGDLIGDPADMVRFIHAQLETLEWVMGADNELATYIRLCDELKARMDAVIAGRATVN
jgi:hypothetical protein